MSDFRRTEPGRGHDLYEEIHELASAALAGQASAAQIERLEHLVNHDADACRLFVQYVDESVVLRGGARVRPSSSGSDLLHALRNRTAAIDEALPEPTRDAVAQADAVEPAARDEAERLRQDSISAGPSRSAEPSRRHFRSLRKLRPFVLAGLAGGLAAGLYVLLQHAAVSKTETPVRTPQHVARIVQSVDAVWRRDGVSHQLEAGDWLVDGLYTLERGLAQVVFPWGTKMTIEAPTEIEFSPEGRRRLHWGQLVAKVSPEDSGFTIDTSTVEVIDLGTEFGLSADAAGQSEVHVFKGAVEARQKLGDRLASNGPLRLEAGEATGFGIGDAPVVPIVFNPRRFTKAWRMSSRVAETTGAMRFVHPAPESVAEGHSESSEALLLFLETESVPLPEATAVTIAEPGLYTNVTERMAWLPAGVEVDSYLVHFDPVGSKIDQAPVAVQGTVTFDRPILGIMARGDQLAAGDEWLAYPGTQYVAPPVLHTAARFECLTNIFPPYTTRGLTGLWNKQYSHESPAPNDWVRLSADRRTLTVKCAAGGEADQLRILVAAGQEDEPAPVESSPVRSPRPFNNKPFAVGEIIQAEDFDLGGQDVAYYDTTPDSLSNVYRTSESVELRSYVFGDPTIFTVSVARAGEWLAYTVDIDQPGTYVVKARVGSRHDGGQFRFEFGETAASLPAATKSLLVAKTKLEEGEIREWFQTLESTPVELKAGRQIMRVVMETNHPAGRLGDFDRFRIERVGGAQLSPLDESD